VTATGRDRLHADTKLVLGDDAQLLTVHTSCSKILNVEDQFGGVKLVDFVPSN